MDNYKTQLKTYYNQHAADRDSGEKQQWKLDIRNMFLEIMRTIDCPKLLEIGAGTGQDSLFFKDNGLDVTAIDLSEGHVQKCREKGINARVMDFSSTDFADDSFGCVYGMNCLLHVPNEEIQGVMQEMKRVLKEDGMFFICQYGGNDKERIKSVGCAGERFFSSRTYENFEKIALKAGFGIYKSDEIDIDEDGYNVQYFILRND